MDIIWTSVQHSNSLCFSLTYGSALPLKAEHWWPSIPFGTAFRGRVMRWRRRSGHCPKGIAQLESHYWTVLNCWSAWSAELLDCRTGEQLYGSMANRTAPKSDITPMLTALHSLSARKESNFELNSFKVLKALMSSAMVMFTAVLIGHSTMIIALITITMY